MTNSRPDRQPPRVGLVLYTVRDECARDFEATLRSVAALGYAGVEVTGLYGHAASTVRGWLDGLGLAVAAQHANLEDLETRLPALARDCEELGTNRLVLSRVDPPETCAAAKRTAARVADIGREAASFGLQLGFHNHFDELRRLDGGCTFLDELLATDAVFLELDLGWAWIAGLDAAALVERARGRCPLVHVKDFADREVRHVGDGKISFAYRPVGDGEVPYERILPAAIAAGAEWLLVEQDESDGSALDAAARSLRRVHAIAAAA